MATLKYLCIVGDIVAQADQAGLELLRAQSARVVLGVCVGGGGARRGIGGRGHRPCSDTYSGFSDGERGRGGWIRVRRERRVRWCWREGGGAPCTGKGRDGGEG